MHFCVRAASRSRKARQYDAAPTSVGATADRPHLMMSLPSRAIRTLHGVHDQTQLEGHPLQPISSAEGPNTFGQSTSGSIDSPTPDKILPEDSGRQSPTISDNNAAPRLELELGTDPRAIVPVNSAHATALLRLPPLDNTACKSVLKAHKVTGTQNAKLVTKLKILGTKMTQRQFSLAAVLEYADLIDAGE